MWATGFQHSPSGRAERLIAAVRVALAATSLLAIWLDPSEPSKYAGTAYTLLAIYLAYALLMLLLARRSRVRSLGLELVTHITDLSAFTLLLYFTEGPTSPFFIYYVFSLFCAALRWQQRGTLWTALAVLALFTGQGLFTDLYLQDPEFELNRFIIRSFYLAGVALMLGYLTTYEQRTRRDLDKLAAWPDTTDRTDNIHALIHETLKYASTLMQTPKALLVWEETQEPYRYLDFLSGESFRWLEESPETYDPLIAEELSNVDFLCLDAISGKPAIVCTATAGSRRWQGTPVHPGLLTCFGMNHSLCLVLRGEQFNGRLFFIGRKDLTDDDLFLGSLVAKQVAETMNRYYLQQRLQQAASVETRIHLARDLHDGLLQSLTGIALQLELARRTAGPVDEDLSKRLGELQDLIHEEQRALRAFIQQLKPMDTAPRISVQNPQNLLTEVVSGVERRWGIRIQLLIEATVNQLTGPALSDTRYLLHEALSNSAKHAHATTIQGSVAIRNGQVCIIVSDDGHGFSVQGRYQLDELANMPQCPGSLKERIIALNGRLTIESTNTGSVVEMSIPLPANLLQRKQSGTPVRSGAQTS